MSELTVRQAALQRRSIKTFKTDAIPEEVLEKIIEETQSAPSSWNFQPVRTVMIQSPEQKEALAKAAWGQKQIVQAPVTFVYAVSIRGWETYMDEIIQQAKDSGAWPDKFAGFVRENAPGFQSSLGELEREYAIKDAMISATHTALSAQAYGLGTCFMNGWDEKQVKEIIGAGDDDDVAIALVLPVGYPDESHEPKNPGRLDRGKTFFIDRLI